MTGQYPFAALVGKVIDEYGPWACSLIASALFSIGFGLFAAEVANTPDDIVEPSKSSFRILAACFFLTGLGTVSSYVSNIADVYSSSRTQVIFHLSLLHLRLFLNILVRHQGRAWHFLVCLRFSFLS